MSSSSFGRGLLLLILLVFSASVSQSQVSTGALEGTVTDKTNLNVAGARVTITSLSTGATYTYTTDENGAFVFLTLPVGDYKVEISASSFAPWSQAPLHLNVSQKLKLAVQLEVASTTVEVNVTSNAEMVQTGSAVLGTVVSGREVLDLPLNGRNFSQLGLLQPGVVPMTAGLTQQGGSRRSGHAYAVNGQRPESNNFLVDGARVVNRSDGGYALRLPIDAIEEFKILTHTAPAEFGGTSGGNTTIVTRSGGNQFHGVFYEFLRNDLLDARNHFALGSDPLKQNQFGTTFGGPIRHNKLFFFTYYEGFRNVQGSTHTITVPTMAQRDGSAYGLASSDINPISAKILAAFPLPDVPTGNVANTTEILRNNNNQGGGKLDWMPSNSDTISFRYSQAVQENITPYSILGSDTPGFPVADDLRTHLATISETHNFSSRTIGTLRSSFFRHYYLLERRLSGLSPASWGFGYSSTLAAANGAPSILISGYSNLGDPVIGPRDTTQNDFEQHASLLMVRGKHELKIGGGLRRTQINAIQGLYANGSFSFNSFQDFLLGNPSRFQQAGGDFTRYLRALDVSWFAQDEWKVAPTVTLSLGLRHEVNSPFSELENRLNAWIPGRQSTVRPDAPPGLLFPGDPGVPDTIAPTYMKALMPRIGIAWDVTGTGSLVVHSGYAIFYDTLLNGVGGPIRASTQTAPWTVVRTITGSSINFSNPLQSLTEPFIAGTMTQPVSLFTIDSALKPPYSQNWNLAIEKKLGANLLTLNYIGTKGTHLPRFVEGNPAVYAPGATAANADRRRLYASCTAPTGPCRVGAVALLINNSNSNYHAAELHLSRGLVNGLGYNLSYTLSKTLDYVSSLHMTGPAPFLYTGEIDIAQNPFDLKAEYGPSLFDARHRIVGSVMYDLPFFRKSGGIAHRVLANWQVNSILTVSSGTPFTVYDSRNVSMQAAHPSISGTWGDRPNVISDPNNGPHTPAAWIIASAFQRLDPVLNAGQFGNESRNSIRGPGFADVDLSLIRNFYITERWKTQFRAECFNLENRTNYGLPVNDLNSPNFGRITSASSARVFQFGLKVMY